MVGKPWKEPPRSRVLTPEALREFVHYDPDTGVFIRRAASNPARKSAVGRVCCRVDQRGYMRVNVSGRRYPAHRLAWFYMTGEWPAQMIDHINLDKSDNRWSNLRLANMAQNVWNSRKRSTNSSGFKGVSWNRREKKWTANITIDGRHKSLGSYDDPELAHAAYCVAAREHFGEYTRTE